MLVGDNLHSFALMSLPNESNPFDSVSSVGEPEHDHDHDHDHDHEVTARELKSTLPGMISVTLLQLALALGAFWLIAPARFAQEMSSWWVLALWVVGIGVPLSLFEYLYHRYLLHSAVLPFMKVMHEEHAHHHGLTAVKAAVSPKDPEKTAPVKSEYPIEKKSQEKFMMFPWFSISIFFGLFLVMLALPLYFIFPGQPVIAAVLISSTLYYLSYEIYHAILHLPYEGHWRQGVEGKFKAIIRPMYSFHLMHHWRPTANLAIVGLWGFALWDRVFNTFHRPHNLPVNKAMVNWADANIGKPYWPISMFDTWQAKLYKWSRKTERSLLGIFGKRSKA
jgi:hemolysin III